MGDTTDQNAAEEDASLDKAANSSNSHYRAELDGVSPNNRSKIKQSSRLNPLKTINNNKNLSIAPAEAFDANLLFDHFAKRRTPRSIYGCFILGISSLCCSIFNRQLSSDFALIGLLMLVSGGLLLRSELKHRKELLSLKRSRRVASMKMRLERQRDALVSLTTHTEFKHRTVEEQIHSLISRARETLLSAGVSLWVLGNDRSFHAHTSLRLGNDHCSKEPEKFALALRLLNRIHGQRTRVERIEEFAELFSLTPDTQTLLAIVVDRGNPVGFIVAWDSRPERFWRIDEQDFFASLADHVSSILEVQRSEKLLIELERKSAAIEQATVGIALLEDSGAVSYCNSEFGKLFKIQPIQAAHGLKLSELYSISGCKPTDAEQLLKEPKEWPPCFVIDGRCRADKVFEHECSVTSLKEGGKVCIIRDTSLRKIADQKIKDAEIFLRNIIDTDPSLIFVKNREGTFTMANKAVAEVYGSTIEEIVGKSDSDFNKNPEEVEHFRSEDLAVIDRGEERFVPEEQITDSKGNLRYLQTVKKSLLVDGKMHVLGVASDVTEQRRLHEHLLQSQKMEAIGKLAGGIAHDFNNLLTAIIGYASMLRLEHLSDADKKRAVELIEKTALRGGELTHQLLGFARKGKRQQVRVDLHTVIHDTLTILSRTLEHNLCLQIKLASLNPIIDGDPSQLQQVIMNLVLNARDAVLSKHKHQTKTGKISLQTQIISSERSDLSCENGVIELRVYDNGCGIPQSLREKVFEPFFTTKPEGQGTGMGLAMVYGIIKDHGGAIKLESLEGEGCTFIIQLPLKTAVTVSSVPPTHATISESQISVSHIEIPSPLKPENLKPILLVDDQTEVRETTAHMLSSLGYKVITASDGRQAIHTYKDHWQSGLSLVILDMVMPHMGARECFKELKTINPNVRAILATGYVDNLAVQQVLLEGVIGFVQKPFHLERLSKAVEKALLQIN